MGTLVSDNLAVNLLTGASLAAPGTVSGTAVAIDKPGDIRFELSATSVTSTANSATLSVEIKGADDLAMSVNVVSFGRFAAVTGTDAAQAAFVRSLVAQVYKKYIQATAIVGGTATAYVGASLKAVPEHYHQNAKTTTA